MGTVVLALAGLLLVLAVSHVLRAVLERARQPAVMAEVLAGLLLGASALGALPGDPSSALFTADVRALFGALGTVAIVAYLFGVGAELETGALRHEGRAALSVALASFAVPWLAGAGLALAVDVDPVFLGTAFGVTAFPVLARIVEDRGLRETAPGRVALTAAAAQELLVWPLLALAVALSGGGGDRSPATVLALGAAAIVVIVVLARVVLRRAPAPLVLAGLGVSALATDLAGLHVVVGAFLFGAALPARPRDAALRLLRTPPARALRTVALPLFFVLPALRVDVWALGPGGLGLLAVVLVLATVSKLASATAAARAAGLGADDAWTVGALMNARGFVELVVLTVGLQAGLIDERLFAVMVLMALITTFATGPLVDRPPRMRVRASGRRWSYVVVRDRPGR